MKSRSCNCVNAKSSLGSFALSTRFHGYFSRARNSGHRALVQFNLSLHCAGASPYAIRVYKRIPYTEARIFYNVFKSGQPQGPNRIEVMASGHRNKRRLGCRTFTIQETIIGNLYMNSSLQRLEWRHRYSGCALIGRDVP